MSGYFVIALVSGKDIYNMHSKVYINKTKAENALKKMIEWGTPYMKLRILKKLLIEWLKEFQSKL